VQQAAALWRLIRESVLLAGGGGACDSTVPAVLQALCCQRRPAREQGDAELLLLLSNLHVTEVCTY